MNEIVKVIVDRPLGSTHPEYPQLRYPVNYGYVEGLMAPDGEAQDAYILGVAGPLNEFTGLLTAVIRRLDDAEDKWVVVPEGTVFDQREIAELTYFQEQYFHVKIDAFYQKSCRPGMRPFWKKPVNGLKGNEKRG